MTLSSDALPPGGLISRNTDEVARVLTSLYRAGHAVTSIVGQDHDVFMSHLTFIDPERKFIAVARAANERANAALLARSRASFACEAGNWHIEFVATAPRMELIGGEQTIVLDFPLIAVSQDRRRMAPRASVAEEATLHCVADEGGIAPFEGKIVDISSRGIGFLLYDSAITLEPGTILKGCRVSRRGQATITVDLEVRYSTSVKLVDGRYANRSGCVLLNPTRQITELIDSFNSNLG